MLTTHVCSKIYFFSNDFKVFWSPFSKCKVNHSLISFDLNCLFRDKMKFDRLQNIIKNTSPSFLAMHMIQRNSNSNIPTLSELGTALLCLLMNYLARALTPKSTLNQLSTRRHSLRLVFNLDIFASHKQIVHKHTKNKWRQSNICRFAAVQNMWCIFGTAR